MGLDNGFILRNPGSREFPDIIKQRVKEWASSDEPEVIYWRKCYSFRDAVLDIIQNPNEEETYDYDVPRDKIPEIIEELSNYLDYEYWEYNADTIWDYEDFVGSFYLDILILNWLYFYLKDNPSSSLTFYDSY